MDIHSDLAAEGSEIDALVAGLTPEQWHLATPAEGWTITHQIAHLTATFRLAALASSDAGAFNALLGTLSSDFNANVDRAMAPFLAMPPDRLFAVWQETRRSAETALSGAPPDSLVPWLVRPLPPSVLAAAGMMELFGHGQDIFDALGTQRKYTDRIGHLVWFAVRVWDFGYLARGLTAPEVGFRFELTLPSGKVLEFGPADAPQRITGDAVGFCLLVTRRRHRDDLALKATGADAEQWLNIAQAYRGPAGPGRKPGQLSGSRR